MIETDSIQVPWGKYEKDFEKRIKWVCICWTENKQIWCCLVRLWCLLDNRFWLWVQWFLLCLPVSICTFNYPCTWMVIFLRGLDCMCLWLFVFWCMCLVFCNCSFLEAGPAWLELTSPDAQLLAKCFCLTRLETRTKESNRCASLKVVFLCAQWKCWLGYLHQQPTD